MYASAPDMDKKNHYAVVGTRLPKSGAYCICSIAANWFIEGKKFYKYPPESSSRKEVVRALQKRFEPTPEWNIFRVHKIYKDEIRKLITAKGRFPKLVNSKRRYKF